jgi:MHS family proline/betaine transporter-like MFS transporter
MAREENPADPGPGQTRLRRNVVAGVLGNVMEWYDFAVYGYLAPILGNLFFPSENALASLVGAFGAFAAGFVARPLGGIVFGHIGDRYGRKLVLTTSVLLMGLATFAIGLLPDATQIGGAASVILVLLRILQGISVGGEYSGSIVFVAEHAPSDRRGFISSWIGMGAVAGFLCGSGVNAFMSSVLTEAEIASWAWRLPFLVGLVIAAGSWLVRRHVEEPPAASLQTLAGASPFRVALRDEWRNMARILGLALGANAGFYLMFVYATSYLTEHMHVSVVLAMDINTLCLVAIALLTPLCGYASDRLGRKPVLLSGTIGLILLSYPLFSLMHRAEELSIFAGQMGFALLFAWIFGTNPAVMVEILPQRVRVTAFSVAYNACLALFGGTAPLVATYLL